ncbi:SDR family oxidoreductase [Paenalkalicoccus suaedae]|uniref:SDR family oxidoreductase n=1 Tax=Paenalkalicoccus suaedae TaxID=2592382 RepID=A0A859FDS5_9BACI|nr:SDR family oxidoreductase [Paenalkalicoccus suaedae]QKS71001.1 SDR family oxidoreductase [Paenalkalicoccus suaedae]
MVNRLAHKVVVITGASSGIGREMALEVARQGAIPVLLARSLNKLEQLSSEIYEETSKHAPYFTLDVTNFDQIKEVVEQIEAKVGSIDVLINNAGYAVFDSIWQADLADLEGIFQVNVFGAIAMTQAVLPSMIGRNSGQIIFVGSALSKMISPKSSFYVASKHAIYGFANTIRMELADTAINVSVVNPGPIKTAFFDRADKTGEYVNQVEKFMLRADYVSKKTIQLIKRPRREINLPLWMNILTRIYQVSPRLIEFVGKDIMTKK